MAECLSDGDKSSRSGFRCIPTREFGACTPSTPVGRLLTIGDSSPVLGQGPASGQTPLLQGSKDSDQGLIPYPFEFANAAPGGLLLAALGQAPDQFFAHRGGLESAPGEE